MGRRPWLCVVEHVAEVPGVGVHHAAVGRPQDHVVELQRPRAPVVRAGPHERGVVVAAVRAAHDQQLLVGLDALVPRRLQLHAGRLELLVDLGAERLAVEHLHHAAVPGQGGHPVGDVHAARAVPRVRRDERRACGRGPRGT